MEETSNIEYFKLNKGETAVVRILHTSYDKIPMTKVHSIETIVNGKKMTQPIMCTNSDTHTCPLCEKYPKMEFIWAIYLYDYTDGKEKCWKTSSRKIPEKLKELPSDWEVNDIKDVVIKLSRENDEFGSYSLDGIPGSKYPYPTNLSGNVDDDVTYRYGLYRSDSEMNTYLTTGTMPKHTKGTSNGGATSSSYGEWAKVYDAQQKQREAERAANNVNNDVANATNVIESNTPNVASTTSSTFTASQGNYAPVESDQEDFEMPF